MKYELIVSIVNRDYATQLMYSAKLQGAKGGTILSGRGAGGQDAMKLFGLTIQPEKEIVLIIVEEKIKANVMKAISDSVGLNTQGAGICFSVPVDNVLGASFGLKM